MIFLIDFFIFFFFFFNDTATTEIYTLSLHDALPNSAGLSHRWKSALAWSRWRASRASRPRSSRPRRSEEHTSELQSPCNLVCRLLLEKKKAALREHVPERTEALRT